MDIDLRIQQNSLMKLQNALNKLPKSMQKKAYRKALRAGGKVVQRAAKENVKQITQGSKVSTGTLYKNIVNVAGKNDKQGRLRQVIQVRKGAVHPTKIRKITTKKRGVEYVRQRVAEYAAVLEFGKENQPPRSWIRKAAREKTQEVLKETREQVFISLPQAIEDAKK